MGNQCCRISSTSGSFVHFILVIFQHFFACHIYETLIITICICCQIKLSKIFKHELTTWLSVKLYLILRTQISTSLYIVSTLSCSNWYRTQQECGLYSTGIRSCHLARRSLKVLQPYLLHSVWERGTEEQKCAHYTHTRYKPHLPAIPNYCVIGKRFNIQKNFLPE